MTVVEQQRAKSVQARAVLALGAEAQAAARAYARATSRAVVERDTSKLLVDHDTFDVVVGVWNDLNRSVLDEIHDCMRAGRKVGILCAEDDAALQTLTAAKAHALLVTREATPARIIDVLATTTFSHVKGARVLLGGAASHDAFGLEIEAPARIMRIVSTSDGLDTNLGAGRLTCAIPGRAIPASQRTPRCVDSGQCHRLNIPLEDVRAHPRYFAPEAFAADILILQSCQGVLSTSPTLDDAWGFGRALAASERVGALITTVDFVLTSPNLTEGLLDTLRQGHTVGDALTAYSQAADGVTHRLFLFGDPDFQTEAMQRASLQITAHAPEDKRLSADASLAFGCAELDLLARAAGADIGATPTRLDLIRHIAKRRWARLTDVWWPHALDVRVVDPPRQCQSCGAACDTMAFTLAPPLAARMLGICRACGPEADLPLGSDLGLSITRRGAFELSGRLPDANWIAAFILFSDLPSETQIVDWPADADGRPRRCYAPDVDFPAGPLRAGFCMIDTSFSLVTLPFRAHAARPAVTDRAAQEERASQIRDCHR